MKKIILLFLFIFFIIFSSVFAAAEDFTISNLNELSLHHHDSKIFYNLGITSLRSGDMGNAVLNLKKASVLDPGDSEIKEALNSARETLGIPLYLFELTPLEKIILFPFTLFSLNTGFFLGLILFILGSISISLYFSQIEIPFLKFNYKYIRIFSIIVIVIGIVYLFSSVIRYSFIFDNKSAVVTAQSPLNERPAPASIKITDIMQGMECTVKKEEEGFYLIDTIDGREGWSNKTNIAFLWP